MNLLNRLPSKPLITCLFALLLTTSAKAANYISMMYSPSTMEALVLTTGLPGRIRSGTPITVLSRDEKNKFH